MYVPNHHLKFKSTAPFTFPNFIQGSPNFRLPLSFIHRCLPSCGQIKQTNISSCLPFIRSFKPHTERFKIMPCTFKTISLCEVSRFFRAFVENDWSFVICFQKDKEVWATSGLPYLFGINHSGCQSSPSFVICLTSKAFLRSLIKHRPLNFFLITYHSWMRL